MSHSGGLYLNEIVDGVKFVSSSKKDQDRRHYQRISFIADVGVSHNDRHWVCALEDISLKGLLIVAPPGVEPEDGESYSIDLRLGEGASINMIAQISHTKGANWGLHWDNIELDGLTHLRRLLELNMADPDEMHRELAELG